MSGYVAVTFAQLSAESAIVFWHMGGLLLNWFLSLCIASSPDPGRGGWGLWWNYCFSFIVDPCEIGHCVMMLAPFTGSFPSSSLQSLAVVVSCPAVHTPWRRMSGGLIWISCHKGVSGKCIITLPRILSDLFTACCSISCVALPSSSELDSPPSKHQPFVKAMANFLISVVNLD